MIVAYTGVLALLLLQLRLSSTTSTSLKPDLQLRPLQRLSLSTWHLSLSTTPTWSTRLSRCFLKVLQHPKFPLKTKNQRRTSLPCPGLRMPLRTPLGTRLRVPMSSSVHTIHYICFLVLYIVSHSSPGAVTSSLGHLGLAFIYCLSVGVATTCCPLLSTMYYSLRGR